MTATPTTASGLQRFAAPRRSLLARTALLTVALWACQDEVTAPVAPTPSIGLTLSSPALDLQPGDSARIVLSVTSDRGFDGPVELVMERVPEDVEARLAASTLFGGGTSTRLTISVAGSVVPGVFSLVARARAPTASPTVLRYIPLIAATPGRRGATRWSGEATPVAEVNTMPLYDYHCRSCGHDFQVIERMAEHDTAPHECPECASKEVERVITGSFVKTSKKS